MMSISGKSPERKVCAMDFKNIDISNELREKAKACTSPEELLALAKSEGYKLSDQDLEAVSDGDWMSSGDPDECPRYQVPGDVREGIDSELAHSNFVNGTVDGGEFE